MIELGAQLDGGRDARPLIGIMPKFVASERIPKTVSSCDSLIMANNYLKSLIAAGGIPVIVPITDDEGVYEELFPLLDGFLLTGGADLDPRLYGGDADNDKLGIHVPQRERVEFRVLDYVFANDVPVLGICRGIQLLNIYRGGTLYEDLGDCLPATDEDGLPLKHWQDIEYSEPSHKVRIVPGSLLEDLLETDTVHTNSMHHQGVREVASGLDVMAYGPGGLVESLRVPELSFAVGLQWHPEYLGEHEHMNRIFERLIAEARSYRARK